MTLPADSLLIAYYGDDFTGSTDVMEALTYAGVPTVLFLKPPAAADLQRFSGVRAVGVAGCTRSLAVDAMAAELGPIFEAFASLQPALVHYKTCSTFDSSPQVGSIGRALDLGVEAFGGSFVPLVVGAPVLQRFCAFGNLFARSGLDSEIFRLDRHPTMRQHPITPMDEADLRRHLGRQTQAPVGLVDLIDLGGSLAAGRQRLASLLNAGDRAVLFDVLTEAHLERIGQLIWDRVIKDDVIKDRVGTGPLFAVGSSGVEYALTAHWQAQGWLDPATASGGVPVEQVVVLSGSCSPVTRRQIERAPQGRYRAIAADTATLVGGGTETAAAEAALVRRCLEVLAAGKSPLVHTALGPQDSRIEATGVRLAQAGGTGAGRLHSGALLGEALGRVLKAILEPSSVRRAVVTGGDTSAYAARALGIEALEVVGPLAPGSPLCRVYGGGKAVEGCEMVFKGGQVGRDGFFEDVLAGRPSASQANAQ